MLCLKKTTEPSSSHGVLKRRQTELVWVERAVFKEKVNCKLWDLMYKESQNFWQEWRERGVSNTGQRVVA